MSLSASNLQNLKPAFDRLLRWYQQNARDLPWRQTQNPYFIWVSEVMLQQTQVNTVIPYYHRFLQRFPDVFSLANADDEALMALWQGLGYYARARNMRAAAQQMCELYGGELPSSQAELIKLKGFGPYTSAAVASIAFGQKAACVDGNVTRVISRLLATTEPVQQFVDRLIISHDPSHFNQSLMELGATVCSKQSPRCSACPLSSACRAFQEERIAEFPVKKKKVLVKEIYAAVFIPHQPDTPFPLRKRPASGRWAHLYELPTFEFESARARAAFLKDLPHHAQANEKGAFAHILTHQRIMTQVFSAHIASILDLPSTPWTPSQFATLDTVRALPLSRYQQKVLDIIERPE